MKYLLAMMGLAISTFVGAEQVSNHIAWQTSTPESLSIPSLHSNQAVLVFVRKNQSLGKDSSTNIAINNRFLTSLHDGHYSRDVVCAGNIQISTLPTQAHSNNLAANPVNLNLAAGQVYYVYVELDAQFRPHLTPLSQAQAQPLLSSSQKQTHLVSRTLQNCAAPQIAAVNPSLRLDVLFDTAKANPKRASYAEIARAAQWLAQYPQAQIVVEGHTDSNGDAQKNQALSQRRAEAVRNVLITQYGINAVRITAQGYGESAPVADNSSAQGRAMNRRVMISVLN